MTEVISREEKNELAFAAPPLRAPSPPLGPVHRLPYPCRLPVFLMAMPLNAFGALHYVRGDMQLCVLCACTYNLLGMATIADVFLFPFAAMADPPRPWKLARELYFCVACSVLPLFIHRNIWAIDQPMFAAFILTLTGRIPWYLALVPVIPAHHIPSSFAVAAWYLQREAGITCGIFGVLFIVVLLVLFQPEIGPGITVYYFALLVNEESPPSRHFAAFCMASSFLAFCLMTASSL